MSRGVDIVYPAELINDDKSYRKQPYLLTAASSNTDSKTIEFLLKNGSSINETGFVAISKKRKNLVSSNAIGAAAMGGKKEVLVYLLSKMSKSATEYEATEDLDRSGPTN